MRDLAWAAGIYEGEGSCVTGSGLAVTVAQKDKWLVDRLVALFGGSALTRPNISPTSGKRGRINVWYVTGPRARGFILTIYTLLSPRRRAQINAAFNGCNWQPGVACA